MKAVASGTTALWYIRQARMAGRPLVTEPLPSPDGWITCARDLKHAGLGALLRPRDPCSFAIPARSSKTSCAKMALQDWSLMDAPFDICVRTTQAGLLALGPEACLVTLARTWPASHLAMLIDELCGRFTLAPSRLSFSEARPATSLERIGALLAACGGAQGIKRLRTALRMSGKGSESPLEAQVRTWLCAPIRLGGHGCGSPIGNQAFDLGPTFGDDGMPHSLSYRVDLYWPAARLCVECDGAQHNEAGQNDHDKLRHARLALLGMCEMRISSSALDDYRSALEYGMLARRHLGLSGMAPESARSRRLWNEIVRSQWEHVLKEPGR